MFCSNCGAQATGNFCSQCGAKLQPVSPPIAQAVSPPIAQAVVPPEKPSNPKLPQDWSNEVRYEFLLQVPDVRSQIARATTGKQQQISAEAFLSAADKLMSLAGSPVPLAKLADVALPIFQQLGIKTAKSHTGVIADKPGRVIVRALCFLASQGQEIKNVQQFDDGCLLEAEMPSDFRSWAGNIYVSLRKSGSDETLVEAATTIKGQMFDWGKSSDWLNKLFLALNSDKSP